VQGKPLRKRKISIAHNQNLFCRRKGEGS
jgi:hypothetical protein